jgi:hypothetical protein
VGGSKAIIEKMFSFLSLPTAVRLVENRKLDRQMTFKKADKGWLGEDGNIY